MLIYVYMFIML